MQKRWLALPLLTLFLSACSQTGNFPILPSQQPNIVFSDWYLRGVFNWWEAKPAYKLTSGNGGWYVDVELIADDQPYDFKFSNANWSTGQTCGGSYKGLSVGLQQSTSLTCGEKAENIRFTPIKTATYRFTVKESFGGMPWLSITTL